MDAIKYVANRYDTTPEKVLLHYFVQTGVITPATSHKEDNYDLMPNEIALFRDLGVQPTIVEIK